MKGSRCGVCGLGAMKGSSWHGGGGHHISSAAGYMRGTATTLTAKGFQKVGGQGEEGGEGGFALFIVELQRGEVEEAGICSAGQGSEVGPGVGRLRRGARCRLLEAGPMKCASSHGRQQAAPQQGPPCIRGMKASPELELRSQ